MQAQKLHREVEARAKRMARGRAAEPQRKAIGAEIVAMGPGATMGPEVLDPAGRNRKEERMARTKVDEDAVLQFAGTMSDGDVAEKVGCSGQTVCTIRKKHKIPAFAGGAGRRRKATAGAQPAAKPDAAKRLERHAARVAPLLTVSVGAEIDVDKAKAVFAALTPERMAIALNAVLADVLEGA